MLYLCNMCDFILVVDIAITSCSVYMYFSLQYGETALMKASSGENENDECSVKLLLDKGAEVDLRDGVSAVS